MYFSEKVSHHIYEFFRYFVINCITILVFYFNTAYIFLFQTFNVTNYSNICITSKQGDKYDIISRTKYDNVDHMF